jgi:trehalose 2-sulfotransferase
MSENPARKKRPPYDLVTANADYPEWSGPPKRTIVVCTQQRSGSTLLGEAMYGAGGLGCPLEYFHLGFRPGFEKRWSTDTFKFYRDAVFRFRTDRTGTFSLKLFWIDLMFLARELDSALFERLGHVNTPSIDDHAYESLYRLLSSILPNPIFIFLTRRDVLSQAVSLSLAAQSRIWRWIPGHQDRDASWQPEYDFNHLIWCVAAIQNNNRHWQKFFRVNNIAPFPIVYEDLVADYNEQLAALFAHLGQPSSPLVAPRMIKQADLNSDEFVARFKQEFFRKAEEGKAQTLNTGAAEPQVVREARGIPNG